MVLHIMAYLKTIGPYKVFKWDNCIRYTTYTVLVIHYISMLFKIHNETSLERVYLILLYNIALFFLCFFSFNFYLDSLQVFMSHS